MGDLILILGIVVVTGGKQSKLLFNISVGVGISIGIGIGICRRLLNILEHCLTMLDISQLNWNRQTDGQDNVLSQADALTKISNFQFIKNLS